MKPYYQKIFSFLIILGLVLMPLTAYAKDSMADPVYLDEEMTVAEEQNLELEAPSLEVAAGTIHSGDYGYLNILGGGVQITSYTGNGGLVDIPSTIDGKKVLEIGTDAFNGKTSLKSVNLPNTVTALGMRSFYNCPNLHSVFLGNGLIKIGNGSFWGATSLTAINIPVSVETIGYAAFANCNALKKINILNSTLSFDGQVFGTIPYLTIYGYSNSTAFSYAYANNRPFVAFAASRGKVYYSTHVQNVGWQEMKKNGEISGTVGQGLRLEGIKILIDKDYAAMNIKYQTHVQNIGWQNFVSNGELSGTEGQSLRLEGIRIKLEGIDANKFDIYYRVHAENYGWLDWAKNGASAGTEGLGLRLEGIQILVVAKDSAAPGSTVQPFVAIM